MTIGCTSAAERLPRPRGWALRLCTLAALGLVASAIVRETVRPAFDVMPATVARRAARTARWRFVSASPDDNPRCEDASLGAVESLGAGEYLRCRWWAGPIRMVSSRSLFHVAVINAWSDVDDGQRFVPPLPEGGRCELRDAAGQGQRYAVISPRETLLWCGHGERSRGELVPSWLVDVRPRAARPAWVLALAASVAVWFAAALRAWRAGPLRSLPWRRTRRDAGGQHCLADGTPVRHELAAESEAFVVVVAAPLKSPYRSEEGVVVARAAGPTTLAALLTREHSSRQATAFALALVAWLISQGAEWLR